MSPDDDAASRPDVAETAGDGWVEPNGSGRSIQRVPGLYESSEATYVDPEPPRVPLRRQSVIVVGAIVLVALVIVGGLVAAADVKRDSGNASEVSAAATLTSTSTSTCPSTTTTAPASSSSGTGSGSGSGSSATTSPDTGAPAVAPASPTPASPPTPRATANPAFNPYQPTPVPTGVSAALTGCNWEQANGGQLQSSGTLTSHQASAHTWTVTMVWLQNSRELGRQSSTVTLAPSETKPWGLVLAFPAPPVDLACALEIS